MTDPTAQLMLGGFEPLRHSILQVPERPTPTATLRGYCQECGKWPRASEDGVLHTHRYPKWDAKDRRGRCNGSKTTPTILRWLEPLT